MKKIIYLSLFLMSIQAVAQVPQKINYQGFLTENNLPVTQARTIALTIKDGTKTKYSESFNVTPDKGLFTVTLGSTGPAVPNDIWGKALTIKISIAGDTIVTEPFTTVPYSFMASHVADNAITTIKLADNAVTNSKLGSDLDASKLTAGTLNVARIGDGVITSAKITDGTIVSGDLAAGAVSGGSLGIIADGTITNADISASAAIAGTKIDGSTIAGISATNITTGTLPIARIGDDAVTSTKITDGTITNSDISASAAIAGTKIDGSTIAGISATNITSGTLSIARIADDAVTSLKIADGTIANADISASAAIAGTKIDGTTIANINASNISSGTLAIARIADDAVTSAKITDGTIVNGDISASAAIAGSKIGTGISASNVTTGTLSGSLVGTGVSASNVTTGTLSDAILEATVDRTVFNASDYITAVGGIYIGANSDPGDNNLAVTGKVRMDNTPNFVDPYILEVEGTGTGAVMKIHKNQAAGTSLLDFYRVNSLVGNISESGGTISYNPFTGSHFGSCKDEMEVGTLVSMTGRMTKMNGLSDSEPIYEVFPTQIANDPKVMGAFLHDVEKWKDSPTPHVKAIMAVGNGSIWIADKGEDIHAGDYLISSDITGHAMKDIGNFEVSYIIARAAEDVVWSGVSSGTGGLKHKKISVFFENFTINHKANQVALEVEKLKAEISNLKEENVKINQTFSSKIDEIKILLSTKPHN